MGTTMSEDEAAPPGAMEPRTMKLEGSVDVSTSQGLLALARERARSPGDVVVDCEGLQRLDAAGVQVLLALKSALEAEGYALRMTAVPDAVFALLLLTGAGEALVARNLHDPPPAAPPAAEPRRPA